MMIFLFCTVQSEGERGQQEMRGLGLFISIPRNDGGSLSLATRRCLCL